ncbi:hypothetical protein AAVH_28061 [Aphelenchoides avenae]|nr:hypothetical protein AAVH_28061 [Aphelenchus avenae]
MAPFPGENSFYQQLTVIRIGELSAGDRRKVYCLFNTGAHPRDQLDGYGGRKYGQLYVVGPDEADLHRREVAANEGVDFGLCAELDLMMRQVSPHAAAFQLLSDVEAAQRQRVAQLGLPEENMPDIQLVFNTKGLDMGVYNPPASNEVAAVIVQNPDGFIPPPELVVKTRGGEIKRVSSLDQHLDALTYPLFNPLGKPGWTTEMPYSSRVSGDKRLYVTRREHLSYMLQDRQFVFNPIHFGGRLTQEYIVTSYARMESDRLMWLSANQSQLRAGQYAVQNQARQIAQELNVEYEAVKVLPSTHPGSPRYMAKQYQNAMAIVRRYGRLDIFLTITCNPAWDELVENCDMHITESTTVKLTPGDRPTIISRVFHLEKVALLNEIREGLFGAPVAHVHVIEYQKRGLPHAHFLITLAEGHKLDTPERVDAVLSAEIPDELADPELYALVKKHMIHGT